MRILQTGQASVSDFEISIQDHSWKVNSGVAPRDAKSAPRQSSVGHQQESSLGCVSIAMKTGAVYQLLTRCWRDCCRCTRCAHWVPERQVRANVKGFANGRLPAAIGATESDRADYQSWKMMSANFSFLRPSKSRHLRVSGKAGAVHLN